MLFSVTTRQWRFCFLLHFHQQYLLIGRPSIAFSLTQVCNSNVTFWTDEEAEKELVDLRDLFHVSFLWGKKIQKVHWPNLQCLLLNNDPFMRLLKKILRCIAILLRKVCNKLSAFASSLELHTYLYLTLDSRRLYEHTEHFESHYKNASHYAPCSNPRPTKSTYFFPKWS